MNNLILHLREAISPGVNIFESIGFYFSFFIFLAFTISYTYQFVYIFIALIKKPLVYPETDKSKRYAVMIAARNEEKVLPHLLMSLNAQTYPRENFDIYGPLK